MARRHLKAIAGALSHRAEGPSPSPGRAAVMALATLGFGLVLWHRLQGLDAAAVAAALRGIPAPAWGAALAATWVSFWAVGRYDDTVHRHLGTGVPAAQARRAGASAIALSQFLGLGLVTGALVRWRMLPSLSLVEAGRVTVTVTVLFLAGWALVTAAAILAFGGPFALAAWAVLGLGALAVAAAVLPVRPPRGWPNLFTLSRMAGLAAVDCLAAGLALWLLWPGGAGLAHLLPIFLLALGAGLVSGTPGGIGAFEVTLLALMPGQGEAAAMAAVLAWRAVYFMLPAGLAALAVLRGPRAARRAVAAAPVPDVAAFPEAGLMRQGVFQPLGAGSTLFAAARTPHALVALREPLAGGGTAADLAALAERARREGRAGILYKAPPRLAAQARRAGLTVLPLAREGWIAPDRFALERPDCAMLRRKLRKAAAEGVIARCEAPVMAELQRLNADWVAAHGGELGFSMGRFEPGYLAGQRVYVARKGMRPVGFASFHAGPAGWSLDLLRPHPGAPDGTAQALIAAAIADAARAGVARLSLAAVPEPAFAPRGVLGPIFRLWPGAARSAAGLRQFKGAFAPRWERLYLIAPGPVALALAGWDLRRAIAHPPPVAATPAPGAETPIASPVSAWHMGRR